MNGKINRLLKDKFGLTQEGQTLFYGKIKGFYTVVYFLTQERRFFIRFGATDTMGDLSLQQLADEVEKMKIVQYVEIDDHKITISCRQPVFSSKVKETLEVVLEKVSDVLSAYGYTTGSFLSGLEDSTVKLSQFQNEYMYLNEQDYNSVIAGLEENKKQVRQIRENVLLGIIGAIGGSLPGGILWIVMGMLGYYAWFAGLISVSGAFYGYKLLGKRVSLLGAVLVFIIAVVSVFLANFTWWVWAFYKAVLDVGYPATLWEVAKEAPGMILSDSTLKMRFFIDLLLGLGVVLVGGVFAVRQLYRESAGYYDTKRW